MFLPRAAAVLAALVILTAATSCDSRSDTEKVDALLQAAAEKRNAGEFDAAVIKLKNALQIAPENAEARRRLGALQLRQGNYEAAAKEFRRAIEFGADDPAVRADLARALLATGQRQAVLDRIPAEPETAALSDQVTRDLYGLRARALLAEGQAEAAEKLAQRLVQAGGGRDARIVLAERAAERGDPPAVLRHLDAALDAAPDDPRALLMKARTLSRIGQQERALETVEQARKAAPGIGLPDLVAIEFALQAGQRERAWQLLDELGARLPDDPRVRYFKGLRALSEERYEDARDHAETALGNAPDFTKAAFIAGAANVQLGNHELARTQLQRFVAANPESPRGRALLAQAWRGLGNDAKAQELLRPLRTAQTQPAAAVTEANPETQDANGEADATEFETPAARRQQVQAILQAMRDQRYDAALEKARALEQDLPDSVVPLQLQAIVLWARGDRDPAVARMRAAAEVAPENADVALNLAKMHRARQETDAALAALRPALKAHPDNAQLKVEAARAHARKNNNQRVRDLLQAAVDTDPDALDARVFLARFHLLNGRPGAALDVAEAAPQGQAGNPALLEIAGRAQFSRGDREAALETFQELASVAPDRPEGHRWAGETLLVLNRPADAVTYLEEARAKSDSPKQIELLLARALLRAGEGDRAGTLLDELAEKYPQEAEVALLEGNHALNHANEPDAAVAAFDRALELEPTQNRLMDMVELLRRLNRREDAIARLQAWRKDQGESPGVDFALAELELATGDTARASTLYRSLVEQAPENPTVRNNLAWALAQQGELDAALKHAKKAVELAPDEPRIRDTLGVVLLKRGAVDQAVEELERAAEAAERPDIQLNYAEALIAADRHAKARSVLEKVAAGAEALPQRVQSTLEELRARLP
jgi:tetratricopeptide (TPR) repeat protein